MNTRAGDVPRRRRSRSAEERFWEKVERRGPNECWRWLRPLRADGYGQFRLDGRPVGAHKAAWQLTHQARLLPHVCVCHTCDNPGCVNPSHLFLSDHSGNAADKVAKGRQARGDALGRALSSKQVKAIRERALLGERHARLAKAFGVDQSTISRVVRKERWQSV